MNVIHWIKERRSARIACVVAGVAIAAAVGGAAWWRAESIAVARTRLADLKYPLEPLLATLHALWLPPADLTAELEKRLRFELAALHGTVQKAAKPEDFRALDRLLQRLAGVCPPSLEKQLAALGASRIEREEAVEFRALEDLVARDKPYSEPARAFAARYPHSARLPRVREWLHRSDERAEAHDRDEIEAVKVTTREHFEHRLGLIRKFLERHTGLKDAVEMRRASEVAERLLHGTSVKVQVHGAGRFNSARRFSVRVLVDGKLALEAPSDGSAQDAAWEGERSLAWTVGQPVTVVLFNYRWVNQEAARHEQAGALALRALNGRHELEPAGSWEPYFEGKPWAEFETPEVSAEDWALLDTYFTAE